jgi:NADH dehydrogenase
VGTFDKGGKNNFDAVQVEGAERIARLAAEEGVARMVHISAIGADEEADSLYATSKGKGEAAVLTHMPGAVILRPSGLVGNEDALFNRFATMMRFSPVLPVVGGETKFQPVYVDDVARAAVKGVLGQAAGGVYELGGPEVMTFREMMREMLSVIRRRRAIINLPFFVAGPMASIMDLGQTITLGLVPAQITRDQVRQLHHDNTVASDAQGFAALDIEPTAMEAVLPDYLWRFRPSGQYAEIKDSAKNLRAH